MGSLPLELDDAEANPSLIMPEFRASLFLPLEVMTCSLSGADMLCSSVVNMSVVVVSLRVMYGVDGGSGVPDLRCVTPVGIPAPFAMWIYVVGSVV